MASSTKERTSLLSYHPKEGDTVVSRRRFVCAVSLAAGLCASVAVVLSTGANKSTVWTPRLSRAVASHTKLGAYKFCSCEIAWFW